MCERKEKGLKTLQVSVVGEMLFEKITPASHVGKLKEDQNKSKITEIFFCMLPVQSWALKPSVMRKCRVGFFIVSIHKMHHVGRTFIPVTQQ